MRDIANIDQLDRMPRLLNILAEHAGQLVNHSSFGSALGLSSVTTQKYVAILERLFLIKTLPPWSNNRLSRCWFSRGTEPVGGLISIEN
ncbi:DUF4143 domain-containing protein [Agrobacterium salinitolerans]